jgi:hypothetical protein
VSTFAIHQEGKRFAKTPRVVKASAIHLEGKRFAETGRPAVHLVRAVMLLATVVFLEQSAECPGRKQSAIVIWIGRPQQ